MNILRDFLGFINKDVRGKNDTKTIPVMQRAVSVLMIGYFVIFLAVRIVHGETVMTVMSIFGIIIFLLGFILTYYDRTQITVIITHFYVMIWVIVAVCFYGWGCGIQQLMIALLILGFMTSYSTYQTKCFYALLLLCLRIGLYLFTTFCGQLVELTKASEISLQLLSSTVTMTIVASVIVVFTKNSIQMEGKLKTYNEKLINLASVDPLTELKNRRCMMEYLQEYISDKEDKKFTIVIGDIDYFKMFNDRYGHACGDEVLRELAAVFQDFMETQGAVSRWGGEEFLLAFEDKGTNETLVQMEKLLHKIRLMNVRYGGEVLHVTMTFGVEEFFSDWSIDATISNADKKLYIGKQSGRNRIITTL